VRSLLHSRGLRRALLLVAIALVASVVVPLFVGGGDALTAAVRFPLRGYALLFAVIATSWIARTLKLKVLLRRLQLQAGLARLFAISLAIDFAFISTPAGLGVYAAGIFSRRRAGATPGAATTVMAADQILDLAFFTFALPLAGLTLMWSQLPASLAALAFASGATMLALGAVVWLSRRRVAGWLLGDNALTRRWPALRRHQHLLHGFFAAVADNMRLLRAGGPRPALALLILTVAQWLSRYGVFWVALSLLGQHLAFALTLLLQALILHAAMWTGVPAGGGGAELGLSAALAAWVPATTIATALLLWRIVTFDLCLVAGLIAVLVLSRRQRTAHDDAPLESMDGDREGAR
jgi:uncharacterized protein (TIRG00374 family)